MRKIPDVFLLAENRLLREALVRLLNKRNEVRIVGASSYSPAVHAEIVSARPQIVLLDSIGLDSSRSPLIATLRSTISDLRIVMVDMEPHPDRFLAAIRAGVVGYVLKDASALEVADTIRAVAAGRAVCPPSLCMALFRCVMQETSASSRTPTLESALQLSRREQQLVELLRQRLTNKEIALQLNLSEQTIKNHVHHLLHKIGAPNRFSVVELFDDKRSRQERLPVLQLNATEKAS